jgi:sulfatase maturation enzyme AslB (radical SAM superfamily)
MIHGGLEISLKNNNKIQVNHCCLYNEPNAGTDINLGDNIWNIQKLIPLRQLNELNQWDPGCWTCQGNELAGQTSFRTGMLEKFGVKKNLSGPQRLDLLFDVSCNLACRTCGPHSSTYWQRHLKENKIEFSSTSPISRADEMITVLKTLDLSNLEMVVFCGGETLMGNAYWRVAEAIADMCPHAKDKIVLCFQSNGTQTIDTKYFLTIERFHLITINISLDGVKDRFEYLRWPASWNQVVDNIGNLRETLPVNMMFLVEETVSIFNLYYQDELASWAKNNFAANRLGDHINHTRHIASGTFSLDNLSQRYVDSIRSTNLINLVKTDWQENPAEITAMIAEIQKFDAIRGQDWAKTFPEVVEFYSSYLR